MSFKSKAVVLWIEGFDDLENEADSYLGDSLDSLVKEGGIQFLLQRKDYSLFETISRITHIKEFKDKPQPKSYMIRNFFSSGDQTFSEMLGLDMMFCTNNKDILENEWKDFEISNSTYVATADNIQDLLQQFMDQNETKMFYIHLDLTQHSEIDLRSLTQDLFPEERESYGVDRDKVCINIILSPIKNWEEKDFNPPVAEDSIVASIIPKQTFYTYMNQKVDVDFSKCSLLIQYDKDVTRKFDEFDTLQDLMNFASQRQNSFGVFKSKTYLGDNFILEMALKVGAVGKFGA